MRLDSSHCGLENGKRTRLYFGTAFGECNAITKFFACVPYTNVNSIVSALPASTRIRKRHLKEFCRKHRAHTHMAYIHVYIYIGIRLSMSVSKSFHRDDVERKRIYSHCLHSVCSHTTYSHFKSHPCACSPFVSSHLF